MAEIQAKQHVPATNHGQTVGDFGEGCPIIKIKERVFYSEEIKYFELNNYGFLPTIKLKLSVYDKSLIKNDVVNDGEVVQVFFSSDDTFVKPMRCDFLITDVIASSVDNQMMGNLYTFMVFGELNVPKLRNSSSSFSFVGTSRDAMRDVAQKIGLGFYFSDEEDTCDSQIWQCTPQDSDGVTEYIHEVCDHAWKNFDSFFACWIDPRYALAFVNMNKMLGEDGLDEGIDYAKYISAFTINAGIDKERTKSENEAMPMYKCFTNFNSHQSSNTAFHVNSYRVVNQVSSITKAIGLHRKETLALQNQGIDNENTDRDVEYQICLNETKLKSGFYAFVGPGKTDYSQGEAIETYVENAKAKKATKIMDVMSDGDQETIESTGSNELASGNVSKSYNIAEEHNYMNNMQLEKQYIEMRCNGINLAICRGEKIPAMMIDVDQLSSGGLASGRGTDMLDLVATGWFVIAGIKWIYDATDSARGRGRKVITEWETVVKLTRREWPIPVPHTVPTDQENTNGVIAVNTASGKTIGGDGLADVKVDNGQEGGEVNLEGTKSFMKDIWNSILVATGNAVKLVSARRYAVDENNNVVEGNAFVKLESGKYKCKSSSGQILYYNSYNSRHLYGEALDFVNTSISFDDVLQKIIASDACLKELYTYGVSVYIEVTKDDMGVDAKHYHVGTDTEYQEKFWQLVYEMRDKDYTSIQGINSFAGFKTKNNYQQKEITHSIVKGSLTSTTGTADGSSSGDASNTELPSDSTLKEDTPPTLTDEQLAEYKKRAKAVYNKRYPYGDINDVLDIIQERGTAEQYKAASAGAQAPRNLGMPLFQNYETYAKNGTFDEYESKYIKLIDDAFNEIKAIYDSLLK